MDDRALGALKELDALLGQHGFGSNHPYRLILIRMAEIDSDISKSEYFPWKSDSEDRPPNGDDYNLLWDAVLDEIRADIAKMQAKKPFEADKQELEQNRVSFAVPPEEAATAWMQIYGQAFWHHSAKICGNDAALISLSGAIDKALEDGAAEASVFASDGEGYGISVERVSLTKLEALPCHYTDKPGRTRWDDGFNYASKQYLPMIRSLQERLRKLESKPLRKDKLMGD